VYQFWVRFLVGCRFWGVIFKFNGEDEKKKEGEKGEKKKKRVKG